MKTKSQHTYAFRRSIPLSLSLCIISGSALMLADANNLPQVTNTRSQYTEALAKPIAPRLKDAPSAKAPDEVKAAIPDTDSRTIYIGDVRIVGNTVFDEATLKSVIAPQLGQNLRFAQIQQLARNIENYYNQRGYMIVKVFLPKGALHGNKLTIEVLEGKLNQVSVTGNKRFSTERIQKVINNYVKVGEAFKITDLERPLILLNNNYSGITVESALAPGAVKGTTDIEVIAQEAKRVSGSIEVNNFGSEDSGEYRIIPNILLQNMSGIGDELSLFGVISPDRVESWSYQTSYTLPVNDYGTQAVAYFGFGNNAVGNEYAVLDIEGESISWGIGVAHNFIFNAKTHLKAQLLFDSLDMQQDMLGLRTIDDHIRKLQLGATFDRGDMYGRSIFSFYVHQGLGNILGGMETNSIYSSRAYAKADNEFTKFTLGAMRIQSITPKTYAIFNLTSQYAASPLVSSEQIYLGGANSVRGQAYSAAAGDDGVIFNAELRYTVTEDLPKVQLATFFDCASVYTKEPVLNQKSWASAAGAGIGTRIGFDKNVELRFDLAVPVGYKRGDSCYLYGQVRYSF